MEKVEMSKRQFLEDMVNSIMENKIEDAREKFHQFVVESAREIHASLIETDELDDDIDGDETVEESFEEVVEAGDDADIGAEVEMGGEEVGPEFEVGAEGEAEEEAPVEVEVSELDQVKALLADLQAKFAEITGEAAPDAEAGEEVSVADDVDAEGEVEENYFESEELDGEQQDAEDLVNGVDESVDFDLTEEDLLGLEEGWTEVKVSMDGGELDGKFAGGEKNTKTPVATKSETAVDAKDLVSKQDAHKGYNKEAAPAAPKHNDSDNSMASGKKAWTGVTPKMDGQEQGGGKFATPEKSKTTPVAKK